MESGSGAIMTNPIGWTGLRADELEHSARYLARKIKALLPGGAGFALLIFDLGGPGNIAYCSSAQRQDMVKALKELVENLEAETN